MKATAQDEFGSPHARSSSPTAMTSQAFRRSPAAFEDDPQRDAGPTGNCDATEPLRGPRGAGSRVRRLGRARGRLRSVFLHRLKMAG